jgi:hypothetical protein
VELGDNLDQPRAIEHFIYFRRAKHADSAMRELEEAGFQVARSRSRFQTEVTAE